MWKYALGALVLGLAYLALRDERVLSPEAGKISPKLVRNRELHRGMQKILSRSERTLKETPMVDEKRTLPSPEEFAIDDRASDDDSPGGEDIDRFRVLAEKTHRENMANQRLESLEILESEIPRDEELIRDLRQKGDHTTADYLQGQLQEKYELLRKLQNEPEE